MHDTDELKQYVQQMWCNVDQRIIDNAIDEWHKRLRACVQANGGHFEHILQKTIVLISSQLYDNINVSFLSNKTRFLIVSVVPKVVQEHS